MKRLKKLWRAMGVVCMMFVLGLALAGMMCTTAQMVVAKLARP